MCILFDVISLKFFPNKRDKLSIILITEVKENHTSSIRFVKILYPEIKRVTSRKIFICYYCDDLRKELHKIQYCP